jgi:hypothetical protein
VATKRMAPSASDPRRRKAGGCQLARAQTFGVDRLALTNLMLLLLTDLQLASLWSPARSLLRVMQLFACVSQLAEC